jgi:hypothetical protein
MYSSPSRQKPLVNPCELRDCGLAGRPSAPHTAVRTCKGILRAILYKNGRAALAEFYREAAIEEAGGAEKEEIDAASLVGLYTPRVSKPLADDFKAVSEQLPCVCIGSGKGMRRLLHHRHKDILPGNGWAVC